MCVCVIFRADRVLRCVCALFKSDINLVYNIYGIVCIKFDCDLLSKYRRIRYFRYFFCDLSYIRTFKYTKSRDCMIATTCTSGLFVQSFDLKKRSLVLHEIYIIYISCLLAKTWYEHLQRAIQRTTLSSIQETRFG